jgi:peptide/nickel transport system substrate-binding protein
MMVSPKAAKAAGRQVRQQPGVLGAVQVRRARRPGPIVVERYPNYWNKSQIFFDKVVYLPIVDSDRAARQPEERAARLHRARRALDWPAIQKDKRFKTSKIVELGYQGIDFNVAKSEFAAKSPVRDPRVREAFELSLDRQAIVEVVMEEQADAGNQWVSPRIPGTRKSVPMPKRDVAKAKALLKQAGITNPSFTLITTTTSDAQRLAQVVQSMAKEAGFDIKIQAAEFATSLNMADKGEYEAYILAWSGARRSRREPLQLPRMQAADELHGLLQAGSGRAPQQAARHRRSRGAQEALRPDRRARPQGPADRVSLPPRLAVGVQREAFRAAHGARRDGAVAGVEVS